MPHVSLHSYDRAVLAAERIPLSISVPEWTEGRMGTRKEPIIRLGIKKPCFSMPVRWPAEEEALDTLYQDE